ncbi:ATP-binding protein [Phenylobacterium sp.]|uniref:ATP-binding protein n=1 Tax=Phenylobacterium sp. TaxID=1871053 RepID=UPI00301CE182
MAISLSSIKRGVSETAPRVLIYGVPGIGKTTFCANAPEPIFIQTEDGLGVIDAPAFPLAQSYQDVLDALNVLIAENHGFGTLVVDSLDWLEPLIWKKVCERQKVGTIEDLDYGKGYTMAVGYWREYIDGINYLRDAKQMMIIQTAHSAVKRFDNPETGPYDRYQIKLHINSKGEGAGALVQEHSDCVLFANYKTNVTDEKLEFNKTKKRAIGSGARMLYTQEKPSYLAKNRYGLPESIALDGNTWSVLAQHVPYLKKFLPDSPPPAEQEEPETNA